MMIVLLLLLLLLAVVVIVFGLVKYCLARSERESRSPIMMSSFLEGVYCERKKNGQAS